MRRVVLLTGSELRHRFFRKVFALCPGIDVVRAYCEGLTGSLIDTVDKTQSADSPQRLHLIKRTTSEQDFFGAADRFLPDRSNPTEIGRGAINEPAHVADICALEPDVIAAYGCSIIRGDLLSRFAGSLLNVHLGLSPYYRGAGTNFWPLANGQPEYVGATFMFMDAGIDTGEIIHQMRARVFPGDGPHQIGNRLIADLVPVYALIATALDRLPRMPQPPAIQGRVYRKRDFSDEAVATIYSRFGDGMIDDYLRNKAERDERVAIVANPGVAA